MEIDDLDLYNDLDEFHEEQTKKSSELLVLESKYNEALQLVDSLKADNKDLKKKIKTMEVNFQILLDTAKAEVRRKDTQIQRLQQEKDDICFRRKKVWPATEESGGSGQQHKHVADYNKAAVNPFKQTSHGKTIDITAEEVPSSQRVANRYDDHHSIEKRKRHYSRGEEDKSSQERDKRRTDDVHERKEKAGLSRERSNSYRSRERASGSRDNKRERSRERKEEVSHKAESTRERTKLSQDGNKHRTNQNERSSKRYESECTHDRHKQFAAKHDDTNRYTSSSSDRSKSKYVVKEQKSDNAEKKASKNYAAEMGKDPIEMAKSKAQTDFSISAVTLEQHHTESVEADIPKIDENSNIAQIGLSTPKRVALFDSLFGKTPSSTASNASSTLLTNVMQILQNGGESTMTTPAAYSDRSDCVLIEEGEESVELLSKTTATEGYFSSLVSSKEVTNDKAKATFRLCNNAVIEIEDGTDNEEGTLKKTTKSVLSPDKCETDLELIVSDDDDYYDIDGDDAVEDCDDDENTLAADRRKTPIEILENIRLPTIYEIRAKARQLKSKALAKQLQAEQENASKLEVSTAKHVDKEATVAPKVVESTKEAIEIIKESTAEVIETAKFETKAVKVITIEPTLIIKETKQAVKATEKSEANEVELIPSEALKADKKQDVEEKAQALEDEIPVENITEDEHMLDAMPTNENKDDSELNGIADAAQEVEKVADGALEEGELEDSHEIDVVTIDSEEEKLPETSVEDNVKTYASAQVEEVKISTNFSLEKQVTEKEIENKQELQLKATEALTEPELQTTEVVAPATVEVPIKEITLNAEDLRQEAELKDTTVAIENIRQELKLVKTNEKPENAGVTEIEDTEQTPNSVLEENIQSTKDAQLLEERLLIKESKIEAQENGNKANEIEEVKPNALQTEENEDKIDSKQQIEIALKKTPAKEEQIEPKSEQVNKVITREEPELKEENLNEEVLKNEITTSQIKDKAKTVKKISKELGKKIVAKVKSDADERVKNIVNFGNKLKLLTSYKIPKKSAKVVTDKINEPHETEPKPCSLTPTTTATVVKIENQCDQEEDANPSTISANAFVVTTMEVPSNAEQNSYHEEVVATKPIAENAVEYIVNKMGGPVDKHRNRTPVKLEDFMRIEVTKINRQQAKTTRTKSFDGLEKSLGKKPKTTETTIDLATAMSPVELVEMSKKLTWPKRPRKTVKLTMPDEKLQKARAALKMKIKAKQAKLEEQKNTHNDNKAGKPVVNKKLKQTPRRKLKVKKRTRRIIDSSSDEQQNEAFDEMPTKRMRMQAESVSDIESVCNENIPPTAHAMLAPQSSLEAPANEACASLHAILESDAVTADEKLTKDDSNTLLLPLMFANNSQDEKFRQIDARMQHMFQSPLHVPAATDAKPQEADFNVSETLSEISINEPNLSSLTVDETTPLTPLPQSSLDASNVSSCGEHNDTKHISLGSSDYRFEKVSENVVNLFITRRRHKKKSKTKLAGAT